MTTSNIGIRAASLSAWTMGFISIVLTIPLHAQGEDAMIITETGAVGIGTSSPARQLHIAGDNAVFRLDRTTDSSAFLLVRTDNNGTPLKAYQFGVNASGANNGSFFISDMGDAVSGGGSPRMFILNDGTVRFSGSVEAQEFVTNSAARFKDNIETLTDASDSVRQLRGVRYVLKESGKESFGVIADEVQVVFPEVVSSDEETGEVNGVNYTALTALLIEAIKEQGEQIDRLEARLQALSTADVALVE